MPELKFYEAEYKPSPEKYSVMGALIRNPDQFSKMSWQTVQDRLSELEDVRIRDFILPEEENEYTGTVLLESHYEEFRLDFYLERFEWSDDLLLYPGMCQEGEAESYKRANVVLYTYMEFPVFKHWLAHFYFQLHLRLLMAFVPREFLLAVHDVSAQRLLHADWVYLTAASKYAPDYSSLFSVIGKTDDNGNLWLYTKGLNRCWTAEYEIVNLKEEQRGFCTDLLISYVLKRMEDDGHVYCYRCYRIGSFADQTPFQVQSWDWYDLLDLVDGGDDNMLGGRADRRKGHSEDADLLTILGEIPDCGAKTIWDTEAGPKALYEIGSLQELFPGVSFDPREMVEESVKVYARERFPILVSYLEKHDSPENRVEIRLDAEKTTAFGNGVVRVEQEVLVGQFLGYEDGKIRVRILSEPEEEAYFLVEDILDWTLFTQEKTIGVLDAYILLETEDSED